MYAIASLKYRIFISAVVLYTVSFSAAMAQDTGVKFTSSDKNVEQAFVWAKSTALQYKGNATDPVGPWYEAALPQRYAFCMRDVSHQSIGAEILGLSRENANMFGLFAKNISASKNWCSYWEINKWNKPAPDDYKSDSEFWYNLPANFDVLYATWKLYLWTGNKYYINDPTFTRFQEKTATDYISAWMLSADSLLNRPAHPNAPVPFNENESFDRCRGLPSYSEIIPNMKTGIDLVAALYRGLLTYSDILAVKGQKKEAVFYAEKAEKYRQRLEADWWDNKNAQYYTYYSNDDKFGKAGKNESESFLVWFDALKDSVKLKKVLLQLDAVNTNIETTSYFPLFFYKNGYWDEAKKYILYLSDPSTKRREYPEVSYGVMEGIVQGLMGITPDARTRTISTVLKMTGNNNVALTNLPVLNTVINISHLNNSHSIIANKGSRFFIWKAMFYGNYTKVDVNGAVMNLERTTDSQGRKLSFVSINVKPGKQVNVKAY